MYATGPRLPSFEVPDTNQIPSFRNAEYGSKLAMVAGPKIACQLALSYTDDQARFAAAIAPSFVLTAAVLSYGPHGMTVFENAAHAKMQSTTRAAAFIARSNVCAQRRESSSVRWSALLG